MDDRSCGRGCCFAGASARILEGSSNAADANFDSPCGPTPISRTLEVQVHRLSGERFQLAATVSAGGVEGGWAFIYGTLRFSGLPEGVTISSCNGFYQGPPVAVVRDSWGRMKIRYR
ncbi:MAG: hypothetical protein ACRENJ_09035 [Candidatus Eiseniibacteriota bacterium]